MIINRKFILGVIVMFSLVTFNDVRGSNDASREAVQRLAAIALEREIAEHDWYVQNCVGQASIAARCARGYEKWGNHTTGRY
jgi:hypothetical protein